MPRQDRPDARRRSAPRPSARARAATRSPQPSPPAPPASGLTTRAAVLGLVLCGLVVSAALPLRELLDQRGEIAELRQEQAERLERVEALEERRRLLSDPDYVANLARERLHFVRPGERIYILTKPATPTPAPVQGNPAPPVGDEAPWYSQLYGTVESADRPQAVPSPTPTR